MMHRVCLLLLLLAAWAGRAAEPGPLLIVTGYRQVDQVGSRFQARYPIYYRLGYQISPADLEASPALLAIGDARLDGLSADVWRSWLDRGGSLVLVGQVAAPVLARLPELRAKLVDRPTPGLVPADHPLFKTAAKPDVDDLLDDDAPASPYANLLVRQLLENPAGGNPLLASGPLAAAYEWPVGAGRVVYLAEELLLPVPADAVETPDQAARRHACGRDLLAWLKLPTLDEAAAPVGRPVAWFREPPAASSGWEGARAFTPPYPRDGEALTALRLLAGRGEHERRPFYTTTPTEPTTVTWEVSDLSSAAAVIPRDRLQLGCQGRLTADQSSPLVYVRWLTPGEPPPDPQPVITWWLDFDVGDAPPGVYRGTIRLSFDGAPLELPVELTVDTAAIPTRRPMPFDLEFYVYRRGTWFQPNWLDHWRSLGVGFLVAGRVSGDLPNPLRRADGRPLSEYAAAQPEPLRDRLPPLDFSSDFGGRFDLVLQDALARGLTRYRTYGLMGMPPANFVPLAEVLYRRDNLTPASPETIATAVAVMREYARFLREKGYLHLTSKTMDEWLPSQLDEYLTVAQPVADAGWENVANPSIFVLADRLQRQRLERVIRLIWMEAHPSLWYDLKSRWPDHEYYSLWTSSFWWNARYLTGLELAWGSAFRRHHGIHLHGWARAMTGHNAWLLDGGATVCPAVALLMFAEGIEEAQYVSVLHDLLDVAAAAGDDVEPLRRQFRALLADSPDAQLPVEEDYVRRDGLTRADFDRAKARLFALLAEARRLPGVRAARPTLERDGLTLIRDGVPACRLASLGGDPAAVRLQELIRAETGVELPVDILTAPPAAGQPVVVLALLPQPALGEVASDHYPGEGGYLIHRQGTTTWLAARDPAALRLAAENFLRTCTLTPLSFEPAR